MKQEFYYPSKDGLTQIHAIEWIPETKVRAVLQIAHGMVEFIDRYDRFATFMASQGFYVVGNDHLGHGKSVADEFQYGYFAEHDGNQCVLGDMQQLRKDTQKKYPDVPYFLLGHSMGSFLARQFIEKYGEGLAGAIIMGTGQQNAAMVAGGRLAATVVGKKHGFDKFNETIGGLAFGAYNKPFEPKRTNYDWLSVNAENVDRYIADPFCGGDATVGLFLDMLGGIGFICKQSNVVKMDMGTPILFISGAMDPVGDLGKGVRKAYNSFRKAGVKDVELKLYPGLRHEILNEKEKDQVYADILAWIEKHM